MPFGRQARGGATWWQMSEVELYGPIKRFLEDQGYVVKGEIGPCDIVAVRGEYNGILARCAPDQVRG